MGDITLTFREAREEAAGTMSFLFDAEGLVGAQAGQYLIVKFDAPEDPRRGSRSFTLASAPSEERAMITTRMRPASAVKGALSRMEAGSRLSAKGPFGKFTLREGEGPALFLAGGIGVTPFRAIIKSAIDEGRARRIALLTSDRSPDAIPFRDEIDGWAEAHAWLDVARTVTGPAGPRPWEGRTGRIDAARVGAALRGLPDAVVYVAGTPGFVDGIANVVGSLGIPSDRVVLERFLGY